MVSWSFSVITLASCKFITLYGYNDGFGYGEVNIGFFSVEYSGSCQSYNAGDFDLSFFQAGKTFGILQNLSLVFSMTGLLSVIFCLSDKVARRVWLTTKILYCLTLVFTLLVFITFAECDGELCTSGPAALINVVNIFLLIGMVSVSWCIPVPSAPICRCCGNGDGGDCSPQKSQSDTATMNQSGGTVVTRTVENTPQGRRIVEEVTYPDGSTTVTETFERLIDNPVAQGEEDIALPLSLMCMMSDPEPKMTNVNPEPVAVMMPVNVPISDSPPRMISCSPRRETDSQSSSTRLSLAVDPPGKAKCSPSIISTAL